MPIKYEYDQNLNIVRCRTYGELTTLDISDYFKQLVKDEEIKSGFVEVVNFNEVENFLFSSNDAEQIIILYNEIKEKKNIRTTIIKAKSDIQFGIARMFKTFHDMHFPEGYAFIARNEEEAEKFIDIGLS